MNIQDRIFVHTAAWADVLQACANIHRRKLPKCKTEECFRQQLDMYARANIGAVMARQSLEILWDTRGLPLMTSRRFQFYMLGHPTPIIACWN